NWGNAQISPLTENTDLISPLLNLAVECLSEDEIYCQIGCFPETNIIGSLLNNPDKIAYLIDNLDENSLEKLIENLSQFNVDEQIIFFNQDCESFFTELQEVEDKPKIGVYFDNSINDYRSQLINLLLATKNLSPQGIIIINNSNYSYVQQAIYDFIAVNSAANLLIQLPKFGNGLYILTWNVNENNTLQNDLAHLPFLESLTNFTREFEINQRKTIEKLEKEALALHFDYQFDLAEEKYQEILNLDKYNASAYHNLGLIYYKKELYQEGIKYVKKSLEISHGEGLYYYSLGLICQKNNDLPQAILAYEQAININPQSIDSYNNLGNILVTVNELELAIDIYEKAIIANPQHFGSYINLGNVLMQQNKINSAIEIYQKAMELNPDMADTYYNLGMAFAANNNHEQSALYLGKYAYMQGDYESVIFHHEQLLDTKQDSNFYIYLAKSYKNINNISKTIEIYQRGIENHPLSLDLYLLLSYELQELDRTLEAIAFIEKLCNLYPNDLALRLEKPRILPVIYENEQEINLYRERFETELEKLVNHINLETENQKIKALIGISFRTNFYLGYQGKNDLKINKTYGNLVYKIMSINYPQWVENRPLPPVTKQGKIKVGYVSSALRSVIGSLFLGWFKYHNQEQFEIYTYYIDKRTDPVTTQFMLSSDHFYHIPKNLPKVSQQIIDDQLHILVFIDLGLDAKMTQIAGLKLAPIQCQTWGHPITSGLPTMDYFLTGDLMEPDNGQEHYTEKLIRLPNIGICFAKPEVPELTKKRSDFGIKPDTIVYLCCQSLYKYLPQYDDIFAAIAHQVPHSQFIFLKSHISDSITDKFQQRLTKSFAEYGLEMSEYCLFLPRIQNSDYLMINLLSDVFLDSFAWSGGHTTLEAIACNLPVVTCPGEFMRGRHSYGILKMLGVTETIAENETEYINIAVKLGLDETWRNIIRQKMIINQHNLYEDQSCVKSLEDFYQSIVNEHLPKTNLS
ncbi:MAG TPA: tetratricopeptide repeat protein, partial [Allocoleopsis sp.]